MVKAKIPDKTKDRIKKGITKYSKILEVAIKKGINESDTSNIVNDMLGDILDYDKFFDVTTEYRIRGQYADYGVKINDDVKMIIEVKAAGMHLNDNHLFQAVSYAANEGIEWVALTNGAIWQLYHISFDKPIDKELVFTVDLMDKNTKPADKMNFLYLLSKEAMTKNVIVEYWQKRTALSADNIVGVLLSDSVIEKIRRDLRQATGYKITAEELVFKLKEEIIREGLDIKPMKPARKRTALKKTKELVRS